jgi:hypothetical protein
MGNGDAESAMTDAHILKSFLACVGSRMLRCGFFIKRAKKAFSGWR